MIRGCGLIPLPREVRSASRKGDQPGSRWPDYGFRPARTCNRRQDVERWLADILTEHAADHPQILADLLMDADEKQFAVLYPKLKEHGDTGARRLLSEIDKGLRPKWTDSPLNPAWQKPDLALVRKIESARGILAERFAFCQTMPLEEFNHVAEGLRKSGYRPTRFRPYPVGQSIEVAAVWTCDGQDWQVAHGLSAEEITKRDTECREQSFCPVDVGGYTNGEKDQYAALWVKLLANDPATRLEVGLHDEQWQSKVESLRKEGYRMATFSQIARRDGKTHSFGIWAKVSCRSTWFTAVESTYPSENNLGDLQVDVQISKAGAAVSTKEWCDEHLKAAERELQANPDNADARWQRAWACFQLGDDNKCAGRPFLAHQQVPYTGNGLPGISRYRPRPAGKDKRRQE